MNKLILMLAMTLSSTSVLAHTVTEREAWERWSGVSKPSLAMYQCGAYNVEPHASFITVNGVQHPVQTVADINDNGKHIGNAWKLGNGMIYIDTEKWNMLILKDGTELMCD